MSQPSNLHFPANPLRLRFGENGICNKSRSAEENEFFGSLKASLTDFQKARAWNMFLEDYALKENEASPAPLTLGKAPDPLADNVL